MINVNLNNIPTTLASNTSLEAALTNIDQQLQPFAVALNKQFIPQRLYATVLLQDGDSIEIVTPMQGG